MTIPATVSQRSEIPEGLRNYSVYFPSWYLEEKSCEATTKNNFKITNELELRILKDTFSFEDVRTHARTNTHTHTKENYTKN